MFGFQNIGRMLILIGLSILILGLFLTFLPGDKIPFLGRLPGDILIRKEHFSFYFPLVSCVVISIFLSIVIGLIARLLR